MFANSPALKATVGARVYLESKEDDSVTWALDLEHYEGLVEEAGDDPEEADVFKLYQVRGRCSWPRAPPLVCA